MEQNEDGYFVVPVAGHSKELIAAPALLVSPGINWCGNICDGVAFKFEGEGCWVIALETLREIVAMAELKRSNAELRGGPLADGPALSAGLERTAQRRKEGNGTTGDSGNWMRGDLAGDMKRIMELHEQRRAPEKGDK